MERYYLRIDRLRESEFRKLEEYIALYEKLSKSRNSSIDMPAAQSYVVSVVIPSLSFVMGMIDLKTILPPVFSF
jgi:hypothetical protein